MAANVIGDIVVQMRADTAQLRSDLAGVTKALGDMGGAAATAKRIFEVFTGVSLANIGVQLAQAAKEALTMARAAALAEYAFEHFAKQAGLDAAKLASDLSKASGETINLSDVMQQAARGLRAGLQPEQLLTIMEVARAQSILTGQTVTAAFNDISQAITSQQERALKGMGIIIDTDEALKKFAKSLGVTADMLNAAGRQQAFYNAFVEATKGKLVDTNTAVVQQKESFERLKTAGVDALEAIGKGMLALLGVTVETGKAIGTWLIDKLDRAAAAAERLHAVRPTPTAGIAPGTGMLAALTTPPGGGGIAPGTGMLGGPGVPPNYFDEKKAAITRALIAAQLDLAKATSGANVAAAAGQVIGEGAVEAIDRELAALPALTAKRIAANRAEFAAAETMQAQAKANQELVTIQIDSAAKTLELLKRRKDAEDELTKTINAGNTAAAESIIVENEANAAKLTAIQLAQAAADLTREQRLLTDALDTAEQQRTFESLRAQMIHEQDVRRYLERARQIQVVTGTVFDSLRTAISGSLQGLLQGTQTLSQAFANMGRNIAASLVENVVHKGLDVIQKALEEFLNDVMKVAQEKGLVQALLGLVGLGVSAATASPTAGLDAGGELALAGGAGVGAPYLQHGGIVKRPMLAMIGEAGPEAVIPLSSMGGSGPAVEVNINVAPGLPVEQRERTGSQGKVIKDIWIGQWRTALASGALDQDFAQSYGLRRQATGR